MSQPVFSLIAFFVALSFGCERESAQRECFLQIVDVQPASPAAAADLYAGDLILAVNAVSLANRSDALAILVKVLDGDQDGAVSVKVEREGRVVTASVMNAGVGRFRLGVDVHDTCAPPNGVVGVTLKRSRTDFPSGRMTREGKPVVRVPCRPAVANLRVLLGSEGIAKTSEVTKLRDIDRRVLMQRCLDSWSDESRVCLTRATLATIDACTAGLPSKGQ